MLPFRWQDSLSIVGRFTYVDIKRESEREAKRVMQREVPSDAERGVVLGRRTRRGLLIHDDLSQLAVSNSKQQIASSGMEQNIKAMWGMKEPLLPPVWHSTYQYWMTGSIILPRKIPNGYGWSDAYVTLWKNDRLEYSICLGNSMF